MGLKSILKAIGRFAQRAFGIVKQRGLSDELLNTALDLVTKAKTEINDNSARREWAVAALMGAGVKESIARLAIELAVQGLKK